MLCERVRAIAGFGSSCDMTGILVSTGGTDAREPSAWNARRSEAAKAAAAGNV